MQQQAEKSFAFRINLDLHVFSEKYRREEIRGLTIPCSSSETLAGKRKRIKMIRFILIVVKPLVIIAFVAGSSL
jgi:hypothetical protein